MLLLSSELRLYPLWPNQFSSDLQSQNQIYAGCHFADLSHKCLLLSFHWGSFRFDCSDRSQNIEKLSMGCPSNHFCCQTIQISPAIKTPPQCFEYTNTSSKCFKCNCLQDSVASSYTGGQPLGKSCFEPGFSYHQVPILIWIRFLSMKAKVPCHWSFL